MPYPDENKARHTLNQTQLISFEVCPPLSPGCPGYPLPALLGIRLHFPREPKLTSPSVRGPGAGSELPLSWVLNSEAAQFVPGHTDGARRYSGPHAKAGGPRRPRGSADAAHAAAWRAGPRPTARPACAATAPGGTP